MPTGHSLTFLRHDEFNGLQLEGPLKLTNGGVIAPTDFKFINPDAPPGTVYTAGGNLAWLNPFWSPCSVPIIQSAIQSLVAGKFREPKPLEVTVIVSQNSDVRNDRHRHANLLKRISSEEEHLAYIIATYRDVSRGENIQDGWGEAFAL